MKKVIKIFTILFISLILLISTISFATEDINITNENTEDIMPVSEENDIMPISEGIQGQIMTEDYADIWSIKNETIVEETVYGDIYAMSNNVEISSSEVVGNLFIMADNVKISGKIYGYAYIMANHVEISGNVTGLYIMGNKVDIKETAYISTDAKVIANKLDLKGFIYRNLTAITESTNITSNELGKNVLGSIYYSGNIKGDTEAIIGEKIKVEVPKISFDRNERMISKITTFATKVITALAIIALIVYLTNNKKENKEINVKDYIKDIAIGFVYLILIPAVVLILFLTVVGIPIALFAFMLYFLGIYISIPITSIEIANTILKEEQSKFKKIGISLVVFLIFEIVRYIPVIGGIIRFLAILLGLRIIVKNIFRKKDETIEIKETEVIE